MEAIFVMQHALAEEQVVQDIHDRQEQKEVMDERMRCYSLWRPAVAQCAKILHAIHFFVDNLNKLYSFCATE